MNKWTHMVAVILMAAFIAALTPPASAHAQSSSTVAVSTASGGTAVFLHRPRPCYAWRCAV